MRMRKEGRRKEVDLRRINFFKIKKRVKKKKKKKRLKKDLFII